MADGKIGIQQAATPNAYIDQEVVTTSQGTVNRQRVQAPESDALLASILAALTSAAQVSLQAQAVTGPGAALHLAAPRASATLEVAVSEDAEGVTVALEASIGGIVWMQVATWTQIAGISAVSVSNFPALYWRANLTAIAAGSVTSAQIAVA